MDAAMDWALNKAIVKATARATVVATVVRVTATKASVLKVTAVVAMVATVAMAIVVATVAMAIVVVTVATVAMEDMEFKATVAMVAVVLAAKARVKAVAIKGGDQMTLFLFISIMLYFILQKFCCKLLRTLVNFIPNPTQIFKAYFY